jgi:hypothetical protein
MNAQTKIDSNLRFPTLMENKEVKFSLQDIITTRYHYTKYFRFLFVKPS